MFIEELDELCKVGERPWQPVRRRTEWRGIISETAGRKEYGYGYDAQTGEYGDLVTLGIIDPTKVVRTALQDAASIAGKIVTTEAHDIKEALGSNTDPLLAKCWLWLAQYRSTPVVAPNWKTWTMWQYTDGAFGPKPHDVAGVHFDRDKFNGTEDQLRKLWAS